MYTYLFEYWIEKNDCAVDCEIKIKADSLKQAILSFEELVHVYKRITLIKEL